MTTDSAEKIMYLFMYLCIYLFIYLFIIYLFIYLFIINYLFFCVFIYYLYIYLFNYLFIYVFISIYVFIYYVFTYLFIYFSGWLLAASHHTRILEPLSNLKWSLFPDARTEEEKAVLKVKDVDFNVFQNALDHHTESYESTQDFRLEAGKKLVPQLVVRRGQPFDVTIQFDRNYNKEKDDLKLIFDTGKVLCTSG